MIDSEMASELLPIVYRDDFLVAVDKPSGLLVHRTAIDARETRFAVQILRDQLGRRVFPLHRLDKGTSGVLLFALDSATASAAGSLFRSHRVDKTYLAIVRGLLAEVGCIDHPLRAIVDAPGERSGIDAVPQSARTHFRRLATVELPLRVDRYPTSRYSLVELQPEGGRRHQLRRHLKHLSHPIIGDAVYGKGRHNRFFAEQFGSRRLLLAGTRLCLPHPITGVPIDIRAPLAVEFADLVQRLGWTWP